MADQDPEPETEAVDKPPSECDDEQAASEVPDSEVPQESFEEANDIDEPEHAETGELPVVPRWHLLDKTWTTEVGLQCPIEERQRTFSTPEFMYPLPRTITICQFEGIHLETRVDPFNDSSMTVEWRKDDEPIPTGSRVNVMFDRGFTFLDMAFCYPSDSGSYRCLATNALGTTESSVVTVAVIPDDCLSSGHNLTVSTICNLQKLESSLGKEIAKLFPQILEPVAPMFLGPVEPPELSKVEGESAEFKVNVAIGNGQKIEHEWYHNGELIKPGSRITGSLEIGVSRLRIRYCYGEDSGQYYCVIKTEHGNIQSESAGLVCENQAGIDVNSQLPGVKKITEMGENEIVDAKIGSKPVFQPINNDSEKEPHLTKDLEAVPPIGEHKPMHFDVCYAPVHDGSLFIEWYKDDEQLTTGSRFVLVQERGYASLDIFNCIAEDSGEYWCMARSRKGQAESSRVRVEVHDELENKVQVEARPSFDIHPDPFTVCQGGPARFLIRCRGYPRPIMHWYMNEEPIDQNNTMMRVYNDGAINYLEIRKCQIIGEHTIRVEASNSVGDACTNTMLTVLKETDFRPELKQTKRGFNSKRTLYIGDECQENPEHNNVNEENKQEDIVEENPFEENAEENVPEELVEENNSSENAEESISQEIAEENSCHENVEEITPNENVAENEEPIPQDEPCEENNTPEVNTEVVDNGEV